MFKALVTCTYYYDLFNIMTCLFCLCTHTEPKIPTGQRCSSQYPDACLDDNALCNRGYCSCHEEYYETRDSCSECNTEYIKYAVYVIVHHI